MWTEKRFRGNTGATSMTKVEYFTRLLAPLEQIGEILGEREDSEDHDMRALRALLDTVVFAAQNSILPELLASINQGIGHMVSVGDGSTVRPTFAEARQIDGVMDGETLHHINKVYCAEIKPRLTGSSRWPNPELMGFVGVMEAAIIAAELGRLDDLMQSLPAWLEEPPNGTGSEAG